MPEFSIRAAVAAGHPCFAGHFPGRPVVPAVLLLELVVEALCSKLGPVHIQGVSSAKFLRPLLPGQAFELRLSAQPSAGRASFRCDSGGGLAARGELLFEIP